MAEVLARVVTDGINQRRGATGMHTEPELGLRTARSLIGPCSQAIDDAPVVVLDGSANDENHS